MLKAFPLKIRDQYLAFGTPDFTDAEIEAVARVMRSGWVGMGPETIAFEEELGTFMDVPEVVSVNSCTSALFLALKVEGVGPGDEVIVPSLTWCASANAALYLGATPVFCDVDPRNFCVTPESVLSRLTARTKLVVVVHYGGYAVDVSELRKVLPPNVAIVEDAAHAFGAHYPDGTMVGDSGNSVCFSFYANKNLSTADGGAITLADTRKAEQLRSLRMSGMASNAWSRYIRPSSAFGEGFQELGYKMNYTDLQAAIGRVQLRRMGVMMERRGTVARHYRNRFKELGRPIPFQDGAFSEAHARHLLVARFAPQVIGMSRNDLLLKLRERNIGASIHYAPLHTMPFYTPYVATPLPVTEQLGEQIMTLPISAKMTPMDVDYVVDHMKDLLGEKDGA
jgi:dTDP-4-amino-4,6-dideoxygalactose transaminase